MGFPDCCCFKLLQKATTSLTPWFYPVRADGQSLVSLPADRRPAEPSKVGAPPYIELRGRLPMGSARSNMQQGHHWSEPMIKSALTYWCAARAVHGPSGPYSSQQGITMQGANTPDSSRRSSRVPITVPILVTSSEPDSQFSEICETLVVSAHGCAMRSPMRLEAGVPVQFQSKEGHWTMAHIVDCQPMGSGQPGWKLGARLDQPENFWGLEACPDDWAGLPEMPPPTEQRLRRKRAATNTEDIDQLPNHVPISSKRALDKISRQLPDDHLRTMVAELVEPLHAEVRDLREKLARVEPKRSQFDISLSHIPPEVEEKLWIRLREDLGAQVLRQTRQQSEEVLEAAKEAIGKKITAAHNEFRQQVTQELRVVEQRAQGLSEEINDTVQQHLSSGEERFQQRVLEAGTDLERQSEQFLQTLRQRLSEEHDAYRREMQKTQAEVAAESSQLQAQTADLGSRIAELNESVRKLESELDTRLSRMASDIISGAHTQLDRAVDVVLKELGTRNAKELANQLDEACGRLKTVQKGIETSISALLRAEVSESLVSFGQTMEALAQESVGRWRLALSRDLSSLANTLGEQFRLEAASDSDESQDPSAE